ncbi:MAG: hypothetical protein ACREXO_06620 [Advenella sp.]
MLPQGRARPCRGFRGKVFQPENCAQRTQVLDTVIDIVEELGVTPGQVAIVWAEAAALRVVA